MNCIRLRFEGRSPALEGQEVVVVWVVLLLQGVVAETVVAQESGEVCKHRSRVRVVQDVREEILVRVRVDLDIDSGLHVEHRLTSFLLQVYHPTRCCQPCVTFDSKVVAVHPPSIRKRGLVTP